MANSQKILFSAILGIIKLSLICFLVIISGCASTQTTDIKAGSRPDAKSDAGSLWFISNKVEKSIQKAPNRIRDEQAENYLKELICRLSSEYCQDIRVYLVDNPWFNAYMMPNGAMVVWSGLVLRAQNENQVAFVLAHELGHYAKQHSIRAYKSLKQAEGWLMALNILSPVAGLFGTLSASGVLFRYSRDFEREADEYGITRTLKANMNPGEGAVLFTHLKEEEDASNLDKKGIFFSTHPPTQERIDTISAQDNGLESQPQPTSPFYTLQTRFLAQWLTREISKRNYNGTQVVLKQLRTHPLNDDTRIAILDYYTAELFRKRGEKGDITKARNQYASALTKFESASNKQLTSKLLHESYKKWALTEEKLNNNVAATKIYQQYLKNFPNGNYASFAQTKLNFIHKTHP